MKKEDFIARKAKEKGLTKNELLLNYDIVDCGEGLYSIRENQKYKERLHEQMVNADYFYYDYPLYK